MIQFGNEHRRYTVERRATLFVNGCKDNQRIKLFNHYLCTTVCQHIH